MDVNSGEEAPETILRMFLWEAKGATRMQFTGADRISEVFDTSAAPRIGDLGIAFWQDPEKEPGLEAVGLGLVRGVAGVASGAVRATFAPLFVFNAGFELTELVSRSGLAGADLQVPRTFFSQPLTVHQGDALIAALTEFDPAVLPWVRAIRLSGREFPPSVRQSRREARDAVGLAASIANVELPVDAFRNYPQGSQSDDETLLATVINAGYQFDLEEELLPLDLRRFDGKLQARPVSASMSVFEDRHGARKLAVFSVNKKPLEEELGVDLLYWDMDHDAFTFVQYKRLELTQPKDHQTVPPEWVYRRQGELRKQLALMPNGKAAVTSSKDWRATHTPFWVKFVRGDAGARDEEKVLKGMYVPADWLRLALADGSLRTGPRGGFRVSYTNTKYLGRTAFVQLVARGFVGTTSTRSAQFKKLLPRLGRDRELIVAVKRSWQRDEDLRPSGPATTSRTSPVVELDGADL